MKVSWGTPRNRVKSILVDVINPSVFFLAVVLFTAIFFTTRNGAANDTDNGFSCSDNNPIFPWQGDWNRIWDARMFLSINLARGHFTFPQAKAIDICWDLIVGRGGQMYTTFVAYRVMRRSLIRSMESKPMHIPVAAVLIFEGLSISALGRIYKDVVATARKGGTWNWRLVAFFWMIIYLLSFGTVVSAMTGYQAQMTPFYADRSNIAGLTASSMITKEDRHTGAVVNDGQRIGLEPFASLSEVTHPDQYAILVSYHHLLRDISTYERTECDSVKTDNTTKVEITSVWLKKKCQHVESSMTLPNHSYNFHPDGLDIKLQDVYIVNGTLMNQTYLVESSLCQPGKQYRWGFSSQLLFMFCIMTIIYAGVLVALHWDIYEFGRADILEHGTGLYRDILDMAEEISDELDDKDVYWTAKALEKKMKTSTGAIAVNTKELPPMRRDGRHVHRDGKFRRQEALEKYASANYQALLHMYSQDTYFNPDNPKARSSALLSAGETGRLPLTSGEKRRMKRVALEKYANVHHEALLRLDTQDVHLTTDHLWTLSSTEGETVAMPLHPKEQRRMKKVALRKYAEVHHQTLLLPQNTKVTQLLAMNDSQKLYTAHTDVDAVDTGLLPVVGDEGDEEQQEEEEERTPASQNVKRLRRAALKDYAYANYEALLLRTKAKSRRGGSSTDHPENNRDTDPLVAFETEGTIPPPPPPPAVELEDMSLSQREMKRLKRKAIEKQSFVDREAFLRM